jgi:hypothetical protein
LLRVGKNEIESSQVTESEILFESRQADFAQKQADESKRVKKNESTQVDLTCDSVTRNKSLAILS